MSRWGPDKYGEPCRECGFSWRLDPSDAKAVIASLPTRLAELLKDADGAERHPDLGWTVSAYVSHVGDNLRIWAERIAGITLGATMLVVSYDENLLATARGYQSLSLAGALWSLERATGDWLEAVSMGTEDMAMIHPQRGGISLADVVTSNTHDAIHHLWDIRRSLGQ